MSKNVAIRPFVLTQYLHRTDVRQTQLLVKQFYAMHA